MTRSKGDIAIIDAYKKGYRVNEQGQLVSPKGSIRSSREGKNGYLQINHHVGKSQMVLSIHRLCAYQKFGDIVFATDCVRHLDGNKKNNSPSNIEIGTFSDNCLDIPKEKRIRYAKNASSHQTTYRSESVINEIKEYYKRTGSYKLTKQKYGIASSGSLWYILNKR